MPDAVVCAVFAVCCVAASPDRSEPPLATDALLGLRSPSLDALASFFLVSAAARFSAASAFRRSALSSRSRVTYVVAAASPSGLRSSRKPL